MQTEFQSSQTHRQLKEHLYEMIIEYFDKGKVCWFRNPTEYLYPMAVNFVTESLLLLTQMENAFHELIFFKTVGLG